MSKPRILLLGYGPTAESALASLLPRVEVVGVVRNATGRHDPVADLAARHAIPLTGPAEPKDIAHLLERWRPDGMVISSFDRILRLNANSPPVINVHYAPLPRYRGRASVNRAIINGEPATAITIHRVNNGLDSGPILFQREVPITPRDTVTDLYRRLNALQEEHLGDTVVRALAGWEGVPQDETAATYACARTPEDGAIDWNRSAADIDRLVRALRPPFPAAFTVFEGRVLLVHRAEPAVSCPTHVGAVPGRVARRSAAEGWVEVLTGSGALRLWEVERQGEGPVPAAEAIRSTRATLGFGTADLIRLLVRPDHGSAQQSQVWEKETS